MCQSGAMAEGGWSHSRGWVESWQRVSAVMAEGGVESWQRVGGPPREVRLSRVSSA